ncbi:cytochrome b [Sphingomonas baiyangensis]|uniref:Cytochrome b n=1 Tax=Sphingomonas baiyangensis TaxID=2572576 RepID=A0A4V5PTG9_9SPHN|nr:cytochrome b [Sphingomonas baiyangensis]TKD49958.1 cytochrome b [Sphingomonas baiyangensis]
MRTAIVRTDRYSRGAIAFHWTIAVLVLFNLALVWAGDAIFGDFPAMPTHKAVGITVLVLSIARLVWRWTHRPPPLAPTLNGWQRVAARGTHYAFYVLMIGVPLGGWVLVSGAETRRPLNWFGLFDIPFLPVSRSAGELASAVHGTAGTLLAGLIALHVAAALRHHLLLRDNTLARMVPGLEAPR